MPILAVLFDFDGVIADTENVHVAAWERTFAAMGWDVPPEVCARAAEEDDRLFLQSVFAEAGIDDGDLAGWVARKQAATRTMLAAAPRLYPGVAELVAALVGRASGSGWCRGPGARTSTWCSRLSGLAPSFAAIVAKLDVAAPKPDPAGYRLALKLLKVKPSEAVALEDAPSGDHSRRGPPGSAWWPSAIAARPGRGARVLPTWRLFPTATTCWSRSGCEGHR